jgi:hypothetical protein
MEENKQINSAHIHAVAEVENFPSACGRLVFSRSNWPCRSSSVHGKGDLSRLLLPAELD